MNGDPEKKSMTDLFKTGSNGTATAEQPAGDGKSMSELFTKPPDDPFAQAPETPQGPPSVPGPTKEQQSFESDFKTRPSIVQSAAGASSGPLVGAPASSLGQVSGAPVPVGEQDFVAGRLNTAAMMGQAPEEVPPPDVDQFGDPSATSADNQQHDALVKFQELMSPYMRATVKEVGPKIPEQYTNEYERQKREAGSWSSTDEFNKQEVILRNEARELTKQRNEIIKRVQFSGIDQVETERIAALEQRAAEVNQQYQDLLKHPPKDAVDKWNEGVQAQSDATFKQAQKYVDEKQFLQPLVMEQYILRPVANAATNFLLTGAAALGRTLDAAGNLPQKISGDEEYYSPLAEAADNLSRQVETVNASEGTGTKGALFDKDWNFNSSAALPQLMRTGTNMALLMASGARGGNAGLVRAGYLSQEEDAYNEAIKSGLDRNAAQSFSMMTASAQALLELVNPQDYGSGTVKGMMIKRALKALKGGSTTKDAVLDATGFVLKEVGGENLQEFSQKGADLLARYATNEANGSDLEIGFTPQEAAETALMTTVLSGLAAGTGRALDKPLHQQAIEFAVNNAGPVEEYIKANVPKEQQASMLESLKRYTKVYNGLPTKLDGPEMADVRKDVANAVAEKEEIKAEQKEAVVDETIGNLVGDKFETRIAKADKKIEDALIEGGIVTKEEVERAKLEDEGKGKGKKAAPVKAPAEREAVPAGDTGEPGGEGVVAPEAKRVEPVLTADIPDDIVALATAYESGRLEHNSDSNPDKVIDGALKKSVNRDSFNRWGDQNTIGDQMARTYFAGKKGLRTGEKAGKGLDVIAQELTDALGREVTTDDLVAHMQQYPSGMPTRSPAMVELADRYQAMTGKGLNSIAAKSIISKNPKWTPTEQAIVDEAEKQGVPLEDLSDQDETDFDNLTDDEADIMFGGEPTVAHTTLAPDATNRGEQPAQPGGASQDEGEVRGDEGQGAAKTPFSAQSLQDAFGYTPEVASATVAIADAMGLDKSKISVAKGGTPQANALFQESANAEVGQWYSRLDKAVVAKGNTQSGADWMKWAEARAKEGALSMEEVKWTGLADFLAGKAKVTPAEVREFLKENRVKVEVVEKGDGGAEQERVEEINDEIASLQTEISQGGGSFEERQEASSRISQLANERRALENRDKDTKFGQYQLPGGTNYREVLVTLPLNKNIPSIQELDARMSANTQAMEFAEGEQFWDARERHSELMRQKAATPEFRSSHFDEPNILVHLRLNDRTDADGKKVLFIEELQSDWGQQGKKRGFADDGKYTPPSVGKFEDGWSIASPSGEQWSTMSYPTKEALLADHKLMWETDRAYESDPSAYSAKLVPSNILVNGERQPDVYQVSRKKAGYHGKTNNAIVGTYSYDTAQEAIDAALREKQNKKQYGVPAAPFVTSTDAWVELGLKQAIRMAVEGGYDRIAWTTGEQQNERYDLSKQVDNVSWINRSDRRGAIYVQVTIQPIDSRGNTDNIDLDVDEQGVVITADTGDLVGKRLDEVVGKDLADKIMSEHRGELSGDGLRFGGSGMKGFYDKILPTTAKKVSKRLGGDGVVGETEIDIGGNTVAAAAVQVYKVAEHPNPWWVRDSSGEVRGRYATHEEAKQKQAELTADKMRPKGSGQQSIAITPAMRSKVMDGVPLMQGNKASVEFTQAGEAIIRALENPNASTGVHELAHVARRFLFDRSIKPEERAGITDENIATAEQWSGAKDGNWSKEAEEKLARGFERYLRDGNAPSPKLKDIFQRFAEWLSNIYQRLTGSAIDVEVSPPMKKVFDALVTRTEKVEQEKSDPELDRLSEEASVARKARDKFVADWNERGQGLFAPEEGSIQGSIDGGFDNSQENFDRLDEQHRQRVVAADQAVSDHVMKAVDRKAAQAQQTSIDQSTDQSAPRKQQLGRIPVSPKAGPVRNRSEVLRDLSKGVERRILFAKPGRRNAAGTYSPGSGAVKIKYAGDLDVTAHEIGHALDDLFGVTNEAMKTLGGLAELKQLAPGGSTPPKGHPDPAKYEAAEGMAEYIRARVVNPDRAAKDYPELTALYDSKVSADAKKAIEAFSDDVRAFAGATGADMVMSNVDYDPAKSKSVLKDLFATKDGFHISFADKAAANWVNPLRAFQKAIDYAQEIKSGGPLTPSKDPYLLARLLLHSSGKTSEVLDSGMINSRNQVIKDGAGNAKNLNWLLQPLDNTTAKTVEQESKDAIALMIAERTTELGKRFGRENILTGIGAGLFADVEVAQKTINELRKDPAKYARLQEAGIRYREMATHVLEYLRDKGRISHEQFDQITQNNLQYVALQRVMEVGADEQVEVFKGNSGKLASVRKPIQSIYGSSRKILNPYIGLMDSINKSIKEADRNEVMMAFTDLLRSNRQMLDPSEPEVTSAIGTIGKQGDKNTITVFNQGAPEHWLFQPDVYEALKGLDNEGYKLPGIVRAPASVLRWTVTHFPVFAARNIVRDLQARLILSTEGSGLRHLVGNHEHWHEVARAGGLNAGYYLKDDVHYYGLMKEAMSEIAKNKKFILADPTRLGHVWHAYENLLYKSETVNRVAEYRAAFQKAKKQGMDDYNAQLYGAFRSSDLIDFALAGHHARVVNQVVPFTNAMIQGLRSAVVHGKRDPMGLTARLALYGVVPSAIVWALAHSGDDDDKEEYEQLPTYQRDMFYNIKIGDNKWLVVPKPFELGLPGAFVERALSKAAGNEKAFDGYAGSVLKSFLPDESAIAGPGKIGVELMANYDFFRNKPIVPPEDDKLALVLRDPKEASWIGKTMQDAVGMDARKWDHLINSQFSYFGRTALKLGDIGREDDRNKFGLSDLGFFRESPAYNSAVVTELVQYANSHGLTSDPDYKTFRKAADAYFSAKGPQDKDAKARQLREKADVVLGNLQKEGAKKEAEALTEK